MVSDEEQSSAPSDDNFIRDFLRAVGVAVSNIDGVPFRMNALILRNVFATQESLTQEIVHHYTMEGIREGLKVLGCLDLIGNPVKLFGHLGDGITDLYYEPLLEGMQSMAANTVAGAAGFVTSITGTVGNSLAVLSMDDDFQRARKHDAARQRTVAGQLEHGGIQFARSLYEGATGIFLQPLKGARSEGAKGFFKVTPPFPSPKNHTYSCIHPGGSVVKDLRSLPHPLCAARRRGLARVSLGLLRSRCLESSTSRRPRLILSAVSPRMTTWSPLTGCPAASDPTRFAIVSVLMFATRSAPPDGLNVRPAGGEDLLSVRGRGGLVAPLHCTPPPRADQPWRALCDALLPASSQLCEAGPW